MLLLLFKNFWWAALWPYCTMQLAMEKAARQAADGFKPPPPPARFAAPATRQRASTATGEYDGK